MGFTSRIGQKIKNGLRVGLKYGAGALAVAGAGYLGYKGYEHKQRLDKVKSDNLLASSFETMTPEQLDAFISQGQTNLGANYGQLNAPPPPPAFVPIGQRAIAGPIDGNPSFGAKVSNVGDKISSVGGTIQSAEQGIAKLKNLFRG